MSRKLAVLLVARCTAADSMRPGHPPGDAGGERAASERRDADLARLRPEGRSVIDRVASLVLPLMHHFVQERVEDLVPSMLAQMGEADRDLRGVTARRRGRVVPESAPHAPRDADRGRTQSAAEVALVVPVVPGRQLDGERLVLRAGAL